MLFGRLRFTFNTVGNRLVVTGGYNPHEKWLTSVEIFTLETGWNMANWSLPYVMGQVCAVDVSGDEIIMISRNETNDGLAANKFNIDTGARTSLPAPTQETPGGAIFCSKYKESIYVLNDKPDGWKKLWKVNMDTMDWEPMPEFQDPKTGQFAVVAGIPTYFGEKVRILKKNVWQYGKQLRVSKYGQASAVGIVVLD